MNKVYVVCYRNHVTFNDSWTNETRLDRAYKEQDDAKKRVEYIYDHLGEFDCIDGDVKETCLGAFIREVEET